MSKKIPTSGGRAKKKAEVSLIRSSAAEYLTFVAASGQGGVEAVYADENVWLSQKMMGGLYDVETHTVNYHLKKVFADNELQEDSVLRNFRITAADGKTYDTRHYNLSAIIAVGYKVNSERAVQFRKWATGIIESFTIKGFAMDDERLKNDGSIKKTLNAYHNRAISTRQVIEELIKLAKDLDAATKRGEDMGLTDDEIAFYDALASNDSAVQAMGDDKLKLIAAELITQVKKSVTIEWTLRESARAKIKVMVKRILNKHGYPPDLQEEAVKTVLAQAELLCAEWV
jgi:hypothetical protein